MQETDGLKRRSFLRMGLIGTIGGLVLKANAAEQCLQTAPQTEGPFYPGESNILPINDLTQVAGAPRAALGEVIHIKGVVTDLSCAPVANANVEIWQACATGKYNHPNDPNPAELDPHFRYWGEAFTNEKGEYTFKSIKPGAYPASNDWDRPPHIHVRVAKIGYVELISQMYFKGEPLNNSDLILQRVPARLRDNVIVEFLPNAAEPGSTIGTFDISIEKLL